MDDNILKCKTTIEQDHKEDKKTRFNHFVKRSSFPISKGIPLPLPFAFNRKVFFVLKLKHFVYYSVLR